MEYSDPVFKYFNTLYGHVDKRYLISTLAIREHETGEPDIITGWHSSVEEAVEWVNQHRQVVTKDRFEEKDCDNGFNLYAGISVIRPANKPSKGRITSANADAVLGIFADIDFSHPPGWRSSSRKRSNDPCPSQDVALDAIKLTGLKPTIIANSGHGLQVKWLFREPWEITTPKERQRAKDLLRSFLETFQRCISSQGWSFRLDSVYDLARIMRIPGTVNWKEPGKPVEARLLQCDTEAVYAVDELAAQINVLSSTTGAIENARITDRDDLEHADRGHTILTDEVVRAGMDMPILKFAEVKAFLDKHPKAAKVWEDDNCDAGDTITDKSPSGADFCVACAAAESGSNPQEIVRLIRTRRLNNDPKDAKADRLGYLKRTVEAALDAVDTETLESLSSDLISRARAGEPLTDVERDVIRQIVRQKCGLAIRNAIIQRTEPTIIELEFENGKKARFVKGYQDIHKRTAFVAILGDQTGMGITVSKQPAWEPVAFLILALCREVQVDPSFTPIGMLKDAIIDYITDAQFESDWETAARSKTPCIEDQKLYFFLNPFREWWKEKVSMSQIVRMLQEIGFEHPDSGRNYHPDEKDQRRAKRKIWIIDIDKLGEDVMERLIAP